MRIHTIKTTQGTLIAARMHHKTALLVDSHVTLLSRDAGCCDTGGDLISIGDTTGPICQSLSMSRARHTNMKPLYSTPALGRREPPGRDARHDRFLRRLV
mgnify:CR=1 FL=1